jgi:uncharacterized protein YeaO (DUF488 family)
MPILTRRWNDSAQPGDGLRILVCRFRPRGLAKENETWDQWMPHLGPSPELLAAAKGKSGPAIGWSAYRSAYLKEMLSQRDAIRDLADRVRNGETITLLCSSSCTREDRCHRSLLKDLIEGARFS